jgi:YD repeat-containing protein
VVARRLHPILAAATLVPLALLLSAKSVCAQSSPSRGTPTPLRPGAPVTVTPQGAADTVPPNSSHQDASFFVKNVGTYSDTYTLTMGCSGSETCTSWSPHSVTLGPGQQTDADVFFTSGAANTTGTVSLTATGSGGYATGYYNVVNSVGPLPLVDLSPFDGDNQDVGRCSVACFAATYAQNTVAYYSLDTPRKVTLAYNSDRVAPRPFVQVNVMHGGNSSNVPNAFYLQVKKGDGSLITFLNGEQKLRFAAAAGSYYRLAGQFSDSVNSMSATGVYPITVVVGAEYSLGNVEVATPTKLVVVNEGASPIARGWTLAGVQRLYRQSDGSALITEGDGSAVYFSKSGSSFVAPAGELSTLLLSTSAGAFARIYPDSSRVWFDSTTGRMLYVMDAVNVPTSFYYDATGRVDSIADYLSKSIRLGYGANGLATITDPMGRQTTVTVDGSGRLTAIADPDNASTRFGYDASLRLDSITDRRSATTALAYDAQSGKLASVTAPAVPIYGQGTVSPVTTLAAWQKVSVPYSSTSGTPYAPARADTVHGSVTDPGGHQQLFTVGHFGQAVQSTGPLGDTVTVAFNTNGQPLSVTDRLGVNASYTYDASGFMMTAAVGGVQTNFRNGGWGKADSVWGAGRPVASSSASEVARTRCGWAGSMSPTTSTTTGPPTPPTSPTSGWCIPGARAATTVTRGTPAPTGTAVASRCRADA